MLNSQKGEFPLIYLGIPTRPSQLHHEDWQPRLDKFDRRLSGWKYGSLSKGGN